MWVHEDRPADRSPSPNIFEHWDAVVADILERYGIDLSTPEGLATPWVHVKRLVQQLRLLPPAISVAPNGGVVAVPASRFWLAVDGITWPADGK